MRNFQGILDALWRRPAPPAMVERSLDRALCEQLIWRRGAHLWQDEATALKTLADGCRLSGFGAVTAVFSRREEEQEFPALDWLSAFLPAHMGAICGLVQGPAQRVAAGESPEQVLEAFPRKVEMLAEKAGAILLQDDLTTVTDSGLRRQILRSLQRACQGAHRRNRPVIWADLSGRPLSPEAVAELPVDALQLSERYGFTTEEAIRRYGQRFCLLGRTDFTRLLSLKPVDIIGDFASLWDLCQGRGYLFGSGNLDGEPVPYLTFLSMLTAVERL